MRSEIYSILFTIVRLENDKPFLRSEKSFANWLKENKIWSNQGCFISVSLFSLQVSLQVIFTVLAYSFVVSSEICYFLVLFYYKWNNLKLKEFVYKEKLLIILILRWTWIVIEDFFYFVLFQFNYWGELKKKWRYVVVLRTHVVKSTRMWIVKHEDKFVPITKFETDI